MKSQRVLLIASVVLLTLVLAPTGAGAQGPTGTKPRAPRAALSTAFTYQGQLKSGGSAYTGTCDMQFALFDAASSGAQIGTTQSVSGVSVTNGLFTTPIDFGAGAFDGNKRFLQIAVKCGSDASYTTLTSLQELTATPYALYATNAGTATNFSGALSGDVTGAQSSTSVVALRGVGVSTTAPTNGQVLQYNGTQWTPFTLVTGAYWNQTGNSGTTDGTNFLGTTDNVTWVQLSNCEHGRSKCPKSRAKLNLGNGNCREFCLAE